jgi:UDP-2,3-diacylglucosamine hydrolase
MKSIYNPFSKWLLVGYPDIGVRLAQYLSVKNKLISEMTSLFLEDKEWLILYSKTRNQTLQLPRFWTPSSTVLKILNM